MKRSLLIFLAAVLVGLAGFFITRSRCSCEMPDALSMRDGHSRLPELGWLRREFQLSDEQFTQVSALHMAYQPTCERLCAKIATAQQKLAALVSAGAKDSPALKAALQEHAALQVECQEAMVTHLYQTSACMTSEQGRHYLNEMLPQVLDLPRASASHSH
jgi:Spy/CpxP family protein refolding chaperone